MFVKEITGLTLANKVADTLFPNIGGNNFRYDVSFTATLRALLYKRVPKEESINIRLSNSRHSKGEINGVDARDCVRAFLRGTHIMAGVPGTLQIHSFDNTEENNAACFEAIDNGGMGVLKGYVQMQDMSMFMGQKKIKARFFLNKDANSALIFIERLDMKKWHLLQAFIPRYLPKYFEGKPLGEDEQKLLKTLTTRYAPDYEEQIETFAKRFDFRTQVVRNKLKGFELRFERDKLKNVRDQIVEVNQRIQNLDEQFKGYYQQLTDLTTSELGLIEKLRATEENGTEDTEFMEYFLCNKSLNLVSVRGSTIEFVVATTVSSFDPDVFDSAIRKKGSFFYRHYETGARYENKEMTDERIKRLMLAIFRDEKLKLRVCAAYRLNFGDGSYHGLKNYTFPAEILRDHTPNQHIQYYACLGNNKQYIGRAMINRDYVNAVALCCASATNINFTEPNTGTFFMEKICANDVGRIIEMPDGSTMTPLDAVKWLEDQDAKKQEEKAEEVEHE